jgi:predicted ferric reductase
LTLYIRLIKPALLLKKPFVVREVIKETMDTWTIVLEPKGHEGFDFNAAQVAWININSSPFSMHKNPFSISGSAHRKDELRFTIKNLGDFTSTIGDLNGGETVFVDGPFGSFSISDTKTQKGLVLLAGGIGVAPIMSILQTMADAGDNRTVYLFYGSYDEENIIFKDQLEKLKKQLNLNIVYVLEEHKNEDEFILGYITHDLLDEALPGNREELYYFVCGPLEMIEAMENNLVKLGIPGSQVTTEKYEMA